MVGQIRPWHVTEWLDQQVRTVDESGAVVKRGWSDTTKNKAVKEGWLDRSPLHSLTAPSAKARKDHVTPEDYALILQHVGDEDFRDYVTFLWEMGCRPQ